MRAAIFPLCLLTVAAQAAEPLRVTAVPVETVAYYPTSSAPATVLSIDHSQISAEINARIQRVRIQVGDQVTRGQLLVELECSDYRAQEAQQRARLDAARAQLELANYRLERARSLQQREAVSEELLVQRRTEVAALRADISGLQAALDLARQQVVRCQVLAPFAATVTARQAQTGEWAAPGRPLVTLLGSEAIEVTAQIQPDQSEALGRGGEVWFTTNGNRYPLRIRTLVNQIDSSTRTREARLEFTGAQALPGSAGRVEWQAPRAHLPADLLEQREGRLGIFVTRGDSAHFIPLPEAQEGRPVAVDLPPGTQIIVEGRASATDGAAIVINP